MIQVPISARRARPAASVLTLRLGRATSHAEVSRPRESPQIFIIERTAATPFLGLDTKRGVSPANLETAPAAAVDWKLRSALRAAFAAHRPRHPPPVPLGPTPMNALPLHQLAPEAV